MAVPQVWVVASHRELTNPSGHSQRYTVVDQAGQLTLINMGLQPVCYPRVPPERIESMLANVDGILLGGSDTNVDPRLWGEEPARPEFEVDPERDALAHPLIRMAIARKVPVMGLCHGCHDINAALGGSLHQWLRDHPSQVKHWEDADETLEEQYVERHFVTCTGGGELERITQMHRFPVSSLHSQGVNRLGEGLVAEAHADDGLVEAFRWHDEASFCWGFQFHPEWGWRWHPAYGRIMNAFVRACWERLARRTGAQEAPLQPIVA